mgnify:CR=1 FL=1
MRKEIIRGYEPPCTLWMRVELEEVIMAASETPVVNDETTVTIDRQQGANESALDGGNIVAKPSDDYTINW